MVDKLHEEGGVVAGPALELATEAVNAATRLEEFTSELADIEEERALTSKQLLSIRARVGEWRALEGKLVASEAECVALRERVQALDEELKVAKGALDESELLATVVDLRGRLTAAAEAGLRIEGERAVEAARVRETFSSQREELEALRADRDAMQARLLELEIEVGVGGGEGGEGEGVGEGGGEEGGASSTGGAPKRQQHMVEARAAALQAQLQHVGVLYKHRDKLQAEVDGMRKEIEGLQAQVAAANRRPGVPALIPVTPPPSSHRNGGKGGVSPDPLSESPAMLKDGDDEEEPAQLGKRGVKPMQLPKLGGGCCTVM